MVSRERGICKETESVVHLERKTNRCDVDLRYTLNANKYYGCYLVSLYLVATVNYAHHNNDLNILEPVGTLFIFF